MMMMTKTLTMILARLISSTAATLFSRATEMVIALYVAACLDRFLGISDAISV